MIGGHRFTPSIPIDILRLADELNVDIWVAPRGRDAYDFEWEITERSEARPLQRRGRIVVGEGERPGIQRMQAANLLATALLDALGAVERTRKMAGTPVPTRPEVATPISGDHIARHAAEEARR